MSENDTWSQCVFLAVDESNLTLSSLNSSLMVKFGFEPGFQSPCKKPHLSLVYGEFSNKSKHEARDIVNKIYKKDVLEATFEMHTIELWQTGGGLDGVSKWQHVAAVSL